MDKNFYKNHKKLSRLLALIFITITVVFTARYFLANESHYEIACHDEKTLADYAEFRDKGQWIYVSNMGLGHKIPNNDCEINEVTTTYLWRGEKEIKSVSKKRIKHISPEENLD